MARSLPGWASFTWCLDAAPQEPVGRAETTGASWRVRGQGQCGATVRTVPQTSTHRGRVDLVFLSLMLSDRVNACLTLQETTHGSQSWLRPCCQRCPAPPTGLSLMLAVQAGMVGSGPPPCSHEVTGRAPSTRMAGPGVCLSALNTKGKRI